MNVIKQWLTDTDTSQDRFAALVRCDKFQVSRWVNDARKPSLPMLLRINKVTGISLEKLAKEFA